VSNAPSPPLGSRFRTVCLVFESLSVAAKFLAACWRRIAAILARKVEDCRHVGRLAKFDALSIYACVRIGARRSIAQTLILLAALFGLLLAGEKF
jgi:hypothetical protein